MNIKEQFDNFIRPDYFSRINNTHALELHIGLNEVGQKSFEYRGKFNPIRILGTAALDINQYSKPEYNTIRFSLKNDSMYGLFYVFCEDMIDQTKDIIDDSIGYKKITDRFLQWKKLFVSNKKSVLTEPQIMGLIGEVLFLKELEKKEGQSKALRAWSGQELTHKDFSLDDTWYEVKTIGCSQKAIHISSAEQLDSKSIGELVVVFLEKMSTSYKGITLNNLILDTANAFSLDEDKELFLSKVSIQGYEYSDYYDDYVYEKKDMAYYVVDACFPKLTPKDLPKGVVKIAYDVSLLDIAAQLKK